MHRRSCGIAGVFALLLAMLLMACNPNAENATGTASLTVTVSDETAKLITPDVDNVDISHYKVIITNPVGAYYDSGYLDKGESFTVSGLVSGEWDVKAEAYVNTAGTDVESAMVKVATTETAKVTMAGENKEIELVFDTLEETAAGTVTVTLLLPSGIADGSFSYWYDVTDMSGTPVDLADKGSENAPLTGTAASGTAQLSISGLNQGSYLLYVSVMDGDTPVTAVDAMRLIASTDAVGTLDFAGSSEATSVSVGLTVEDLIGDILEFSLKDGTEFNFTEDTFSLAFPEAYSYKWYVDGNDWNSKVAEKESSGDSGAEGDTGTASNYQAYTLSGLSSLGIGRHVLTVVAYLPDMQISVGSVDIILNKVNIGVEIPSEEVTVSYYDLAKHLELGDNEINMGFTKDGGGVEFPYRGEWNDLNGDGEVTYDELGLEAVSGELTEYFNFSPEVGVLHSKNTDPMCPWGPYPYEYITFPSSVRYLGAPATLTGYDGSASFNLKVIVFNEEAPLIAAVEDEDEYNRLIEIADSIDINALEDIDTEDEAKACSILTMNSAMWLLYLGVSASPENPLGEPVEFYAQGLNLTEFFFEKVISDTNGMMPFMGNFGKITLAETSQIKAIDGLFISEDSILYGIYDSAVFTSPGRDGFIAEFDTAAAGIKGFADSIGIGIDVHFAPFMESTDGERKFLITFAPELKRVPSLEITDINSLEMWYYPAGGDYKTFLGNAEFIGKDINWYSDSVIDEVELGNGIIFGTEDTNFDDYTIGAEYETECIAFTPTLNGLHIKTLKLGEGAYAYRSLFGGETYSYHSAEPGFRLDELVLTKDFKNIIEEYLYHPGYLFGNNRFGSSEIIDITPLKLTVEEGLTRIPSYLFGHPEAGSATGFIQEHTIFSDIGFPSTLKEIGDYAFYDAEFANENVHMIIPENVETIGNHAFYRAKLKSIYLPAATSLGDSYSITSGIKIYRSDDYTLEEYAAEVGITIPEGFTGGTLVSNT